VLVCYAEAAHNALRMPTACCWLYTVHY